MTDSRQWSLASLDGVLDVLGENLDQYAAITTDDEVEEAHGRLIELLASAIQAVAAAITDAAVKDPTLAPVAIVARLRERATELSPESTRWYDPGVDWPAGWYTGRDDGIAPEHLIDKLAHAEAERDRLKAAVERVRALHTLDGHGPGWAGSEPVDAHAWCEGCEAGGLDDDGQCPTLAALDGGQDNRRR